VHNCVVQQRTILIIFPLNSAMKCGNRKYKRNSKMKWEPQNRNTWKRTDDADNFRCQGNGLIIMVKAEIAITSKKSVNPVYFYHPLMPRSTGNIPYQYVQLCFSNMYSMFRAQVQRTTSPRSMVSKEKFWNLLGRLPRIDCWMLVLIRPSMYSPMYGHICFIICTNIMN